MKKRFAAIVSLLILSLPLLGQIRGRIEGTVVDEQQNPIPKVKVTIISQRTTSLQFNTTTNNEGKFTQIGIYPGYYQITLKKDEYQPVTKEIRVTIAETAKFLATLKRMDAAMEQALSGADKNFVRGNKLLEQEKFSEAAAAYEEAIKLTPDNWGYHFNLGISYKKMKDQEKALAAFQKAAELNPDSYGCNKETGEALAQLGRFEESKPYYEKAVGMSTDDPDAYYNYGVVLTNLGESAEALTAMEKAVEIKEDHADALYQLGTLYVGQNRKEDAIRTFEKFLEVAPDHEKAALAQQLLDYLKK